MRRNPGHSPLSWRGPTKESSLPDARRARCALLVLAAVGFAWLLTPRIYGPFTDHLHKEDGLIFLSGDQAGESLLTTYTGYLHVGPRLVTQTCTAAPPEAFAACVAGGSAGFRVALMVLVFAVLSPYVRRWGWALGAAGLVIFGGIGQQEVLGNVTNLRWFLDTAATMALLGSFKRLGLIILASALLILGVLSDWPCCSRPSRCGGSSPWMAARNSSRRCTSQPPLYTSHSSNQRRGGRISPSSSWIP